MPLIAKVGTLLFVGCTSQADLVEQQLALTNAKIELAKATGGIASTYKRTEYPDGKVVQEFNDSRVAETQAQALRMESPESLAQTIVKTTGSVLNNGINQVGANAAVGAVTYLGKQIANMDRSSSVVTNTTTSGDTMGDNANNSGTMQTGDGRINSNDATATPTVVTQPAPVIVQPEVVKADVVQVPSDTGDQ